MERIAVFAQFTRALPQCLVALAMGCPTSLPSGPVTVEVEGALRVAAFCGDETFHTRGTTLEFTPSSDTCRIDTKLNPVLPIHGELTLSKATSYRCTVDADMQLVCIEG